MVAAMKLVKHESGKLQAQHAGAMHLAAPISAFELSTRQLDGCQLDPSTMQFSQAAFNTCSTALPLTVLADRSTAQRTGRPTNDESVVVLQTPSPTCSAVNSDHYSAERCRQAQGGVCSVLTEPASQGFAKDVGC
jgi:hypothetical protein